MTNLQEAKLAREAEICYATMAMVTDYDCWRAGHDDVTVDQIVAVMHQNAANAAKVLRAAVRAVPAERTCACASAMKYAILTSRDAIPAATRKKLDPIVGKYLYVISLKEACMSILVVGSVAFDSIETPSGRVDHAWAARRRISRWPPATSPCARDRRGGRRFHSRATRTY